MGVSSRGVGSVEQKLGQTIVGDDFELICWDIVSDPSTPGAFITMNGEEELQQYVESKEETKPLLDDRFDAAEEILKSFI